MMCKRRSWQRSVFVDGSINSKKIKVTAIKLWVICAGVVVREPFSKRWHSHA